VLALFLIECWTLPRPIYPKDPPGSLLKPAVEQSDIADFLKRQPGWFRVQFDEDAVPYNFGDWHGIEQFGGYTASMPERVQRMFGDPRAPRLFGIEYRVARQPAHPWEVEVFRSRSGLNVYRDPRIGEPLWAVHDSPCGGSDSLRVAARDSEEMAIDAELGCPGLVVAGDPWYSGWRAWIDGRRVRIREFEGVVRAVPVEAGRHRVEFRYRPGSVYWGAGLSALGLTLAIIVSARTQRLRTPLPRAAGRL
jgi:Bacterial membrane protein YfhO